MTDELTPTVLRHLMRQPPPEALNVQFQNECDSTREADSGQNTPGSKPDPDQIGTFLDRAFFANVRLVTLASDAASRCGELTPFFRTLPTALPKLGQASFFTAGSDSTGVFAACHEVHRQYAAMGKIFSVLIGVQGLEEVHDKLCGRPGSFANAEATLAGLREAMIPAQALCTISQTNLWQVDELLRWSRKRRFRIQFCVERASRPPDCRKTPPDLRTFNPDETRHLVSFFHKLLLDHESDEGSRLGYQSILSNLTGGESIVSHPAQTTLTLKRNQAGHFSLCALENDSPALKIAATTHPLAAEEQLPAHFCTHSACTLYSHGTIIPSEVMRRAEAGLATKQLAATPSPSSPLLAVRTGPFRNLLIIGWYGTETNGDVAILAGVLDYYRNRGTTAFTVCSLFPFYSHATLLPLAKELGVQLSVSSYDDPATVDHLNRFDAVSMAGGPLMDIEQTELVRNIFRRARARGIPCHLDGCGIGPLHQPRFQAVVAEILKLATEIRLRDQASAGAAHLLATGLTTAVIADPSIDYIRKQRIRWQPLKSGLIRAWLRRLTPEYPQATSIHESTELLVEFLRKILLRYPEHRLEFGAMHWFPVGGDDREFAQKLATRLDNPRTQVDMVPRPPREILAQMAGAELNLCMRFHSVVFAHTIGAPFIALDYTAGGKVSGFLKQTGHADRELRYPDLAGLTPNNLSTHICPPPAHDQRS